MGGRFWLACLGGLILAGAMGSPLLAIQPRAMRPLSAAVLASGGKNAAPPSGKLDASGAMTDIHDIKPLVSVPLPGAIPRGLWFILLGLAGAALVGAGWVYLRKRGRCGKPTHSPPPPPPEVVAREALDALGAERGIDEKHFYFRLSAILRAYLDGRFGLETLEMTTEELLPAMEGTGMARPLKSELREFLAFSDPVKFGDVIPEQLRRDRDIDFVRRLVERTQPEASVLETGKGRRSRLPVSGSSIG